MSLQAVTGEKNGFWQSSNTKINTQAVTAEKNGFWQFSNTKINTEAVTAKKKKVLTIFKYKD